MSGIEQVGVIGGGLMGSGIIEVAARAGLDVIGVEINAEAATAAAGRVEGSLRRAESRGKIESAEVTAVLDSHPIRDRARRPGRPRSGGRGRQ